MAINEIWIPSPNYSYRDPNSVCKAVLHATEGIMRIRDLGNFFQGDVGASSHFGSDNYENAVFGAYVDENDSAWTQGGRNPDCISIEQCAPSGASYNYSRGYWLDNYDRLLHNTAIWLAYISPKWNIPLVELTPSQAQDSWSRGVCQHVDLGPPGSNHGDCGPGYPIDKVLEWARAGTPSTPPIQEAPGMNASSAYDRAGNSHFACIGATDGSVYYLAPGSDWYKVDPNQSGALGGADIAIDLSNNMTVITYINRNKNVCTYHHEVNSGRTWIFKNWGGQAQ